MIAFSTGRCSPDTGMGACFGAWAWYGGSMPAGRGISQGQAHSLSHILPLWQSQWMAFDVTGQNLQPWDQLLVPRLESGIQKETD